MTKPSPHQAQRLAKAVREALAVRQEQKESEDDVPIGDLLDAVYELEDAAAALASYVLDNDLIEKPF